MAGQKSSFKPMRRIPTRLTWPLAFLLALALPVPAAAQGTAAAADAPLKALPKQRIESVYRNGDIDSVIFYLKQGRDKPMFLDKSDSVLAFKYLGIIYAADKDKREKGRYYFNQMLRLDPGASITELLPGESARSIYKEVREEFFELNPGLARHSNAAAAPPATATASADDEEEEKAALPPSTPLAAPAKTLKPRRSHAVWWWVAGGALVAGAAGLTVALLDGPVETHAIHD
jgi:hypothetical protein